MPKPPHGTIYGWGCGPWSRSRSGLDLDSESRHGRLELLGDLRKLRGTGAHLLAALGDAAGGEVHARDILSDCLRRLRGLRHTDVGVGHTARCLADVLAHVPGC